MLERKVYILKTGPYDPCEGGLSRHRGFEQITTQNYSPHLSDPDYVQENVELEKVSNTDLIFCSEALRTQETAEVIKELLQKVAKIEITPYLNEIKFSLKALLYEDEYQREGSNLVRKRFIEAFIDDSLLEKRNEIFRRIKGLLKLLEGQPPEQKIVCVSHSFLMKILQSYAKDSRLFENPELLSKYFDFTKRTFECCEGFDFKITYNDLTRVKLI